MKRIYACIAMLFVSLVAQAQNAAIQNHCFQGGTKAQTQGLSSVNYLNGIIPSCTVTVYLTGTQTKATIYSNSGGTPLSNPFTANNAASTDPGGWIFWAATGQSYDVVLSGGVSPNVYFNPVTLTDVNGGGGGGGGTVLPFWFDVRSYGAKVDGSTDDTAAVNAAVAAAVSAGGGTVFVPAGTMVTQPIQGASNVGFTGIGTSQTTWKLISGATPVAPSGSGTCSTTASVIIECYTSGWSIANMTVDGNSSGQSATTSHGIYVSAHSYSPTGKTEPSIRNVTVQFTESDGIHIDFGSAGQGQHSNVTVYGAGGIGIYAGSYDTQWTNINVGQSGLQGIYMAVSANHFTSVKSWFSGAVTPSAGTGILSVAGNNQCDSCEAQDNQANGIYLDGATGNVFTGVVATGNNRTSATSGVGVLFSNATGNVVIGNAQGGADFAASQLYAVQFNGSSANNHVRLTSSANVTGLIHGTTTNEDVLVIDAGGTNQSQLLGTNINMTGPIVSTSYVGSIAASSSAFQSLRIGNGTNTWFPTVEGSTGTFGIQDGSTSNYPMEIAEGAPADSISVSAGGLTTTKLANNATAVTQAASNSSTAPATTAFVNSIVLRWNLTTTSGTSDNVTVTGVTASSFCAISPNNATAATNIATTYISGKTTNQITVTHAATAGMSYNGICTPN